MLAYKFPQIANSKWAKTCYSNKVLEFCPLIGNVCFEMLYTEPVVVESKSIRF